jgi:hypothetical protein
LALAVCAHKPARRGPAMTSTSGAPTEPFRVRAGCPHRHNALAHVPIAAADDRRRAGLVELLSSDPTLEIVGQASTRGEAVERARRRTPGASQLGADDRLPAMRASRRGAEARTGRAGTQPGPRQAFSDKRLAPSQGALVCAVHASDGQRRLDPGYPPRRLPGSPRLVPTILKPSLRRDGDCGGPGTSPVLTLRAGMTRSRAAGAAHDSLPRHRRWARARQILSTIERRRIDPRLDRTTAGPRAAADPGRHRRGGTV